MQGPVRGVASYSWVVGSSASVFGALHAQSQACPATLTPIDHCFAAALLMLLITIRLKSLQQHFKKKRTQPEATSPSLTVEDDAVDVVQPPRFSTDDEEYESRPKRRSVSIDVAGLPPAGHNADRRPSLEQWHEARRAR